MDKNSDIKSWRACRVHLRPGQADTCWADVPYEQIQDIGGIEGDLVISSEYSDGAWRFAAGVWAWFEWV